MRLLLSENIPLRTSGALGNFAEEFVLAHRYGNLTSGRFKLNRLDDSNFFAADHPMELNNCFIDAQRTTSWERQLKSDAAGNTWTQVRFAAPVPAGFTASATGIGKRSVRTGAVTENPADILEDFFRLAGRSDRWFDDLCGEAGEAGLRLAGSLDSVMSLRAGFDAVTGSCGAIWCPEMGRLYPVTTPSGYIGRLDRLKVKNLRARADLTNTADILRLYYDPDKAEGKSQHYIELTANPQRYGGVAIAMTFDWLRTPSNAESVGRRVLPWLAGKRYDVEFDCDEPTVRPGQWWRIAGHRQWPFDGDDPIAMILDARVRINAKSVACQGKVLVSAPEVVITAHSAALPTTREAGVEVSSQGGLTTLLLFDENEKPLVGASVSLDRGEPKKTNAQGEVVFAVKVDPKKPKQHRLAAQAPGRQATVQLIWL